MVSYRSFSFYLQITPKPENNIKRLQNNYNVSKNTYIAWLKVSKIYGISGVSTVKRHDSTWLKHRKAPLEINLKYEP